MSDEVRPREDSAKTPGDGAKTDGALDWITIEGLRSIRSLKRLKLHPINVLIGANGSGKSNFFGAFALLHAICAGRLQHYVHRFGGADRFLYFGAERTTEVEFDLSFSDERNRYHIVLEVGAADVFRVASEVTYFWDKEHHPRPYNKALSPNGNEAAISASNLHGMALHVRRHLDSWRVYHFHNTSAFAPLRKTANVHDRHTLEADGSNLPAFLLALHETHPGAYSMIRNTVRLAMPFFDDFVLRPFGQHNDAIRLQ